MKAPYTGQPLDRVDARLKVTGGATYAAEVPVANVAHAVIVGSTIGHGRIVAIDARAAGNATGVLAVLSHENAPRLPGIDKIGKGNGRGVQVLQDADIRYGDQPIAVVVADTLERAHHAASLVAVKYEEQPLALEIEPELPRAYAPKPPNRPPVDSSRGDFDGAFRAAPVKVEATYTTPVHHHNPMEMHATVAVWQGAGKLTVYDSTQGIFEVRQRLADAFGLPRENVRVISHYCGGGFGSKGSPWSHVYLAALAGRVVGRAVKLMVTRAQMFGFVGHRARTIQNVAVAARRDGTLVAVRHQATSYTSRFDEFLEPSAYATRILYACPNVRTSHRLVRLDLPTPTFTRAPGEATGVFALESALDELAAALRMDPVALRLKNHADRDPNENKPWSSKSLKECYARAAEQFGWARRKPGVRAVRDGRALVGWGMASATYPARLRPASALARIRADGTALVLSGSQDIGTGTYTVMTQVAADALGLPIEKVRFDLGDTTFPEAPLSAGSFTALSVGSAVKLAALEALASLAHLAVADSRSPLHGLAPDELDAADGVLSARKDPQRSDSYAAILGRAGKKELEARIDNKEDEDRKNWSTHAFGAHFVEVRVDEDLGTVRVSRVVSAFGCGKILNPKTARNQLLGGIVWGIGLALEEHSVRDARQGRVITRDLADYHVPVNADVPPIEIIMVPEDDAHIGPVGAKGLGEIGIVGVGAAVANAVYHATGKRVRDLPITVDKLVDGNA